MANVIARMGRPAIVFAPNKTLAAQLYSRVPRVLPEERGRVLRQLLRLLPARGLRAAARPVHREGLRRSTSTSSRCACRRPRALLERRDVVIVATRVGASTASATRATTTRWCMTLRVRRQARPARRDRAADPHAVHSATRPTSRAAPSACAATRSTSSRPSIPSWRCASSCSTTRSRSLQLFDPLTGRIRQKIPRFTVYPSQPLRDAARDACCARSRRIKDELRERLDEFVKARQAGRGAAARAAHALRPRDAAGDRPLQGHRELHAPPVGRGAGRAAADAGRLPAAGRADVPRREPRDDRPARRHVQRRPRAQDHAGRVRLPAARRRSTTGR